jgi:hypothetical protein
MTRSNKLTIYSNGLTRVQRYVKVEGKTTITIPVRKKYVADVVATFGVKGNVRVVEPPSYSTPPKNGLSLDPKNVYYELATKLSGASVRVHANGVGGKPVEGVLCGVHMVETMMLGHLTKNIEFVVSTSNGINTFNQSAVNKLEFTSPEVQQLIQSALSRNFETVRPESVLVKLVLEPIDGVAAVEALLDYATPTAAWQSVYKVEVGDKETILEYNAKLDNPTDEDWLACNVCCVVGDPITFDTDLGEVRTPQRTKVNLVDEKSVGPVHAQEAVRRSTPKGGGRMAYASSAPMMKMCSMGGFESAGGGLEAVAASYDSSYEEEAIQSGATAEEVGDFAKFTSEDVIDVRSNVGGIVRLFRKPIESKEVLFFAAAQDSERAYRGLRLTNTTESTLGKGMATAYLKGDNLGGQAVFNTLKPGKSQTLVFSRENGVTVTHNNVGGKVSRIAVGFSNGELWWQERVKNETLFSFDNLHKEDGFSVEVNHDFTQNEPTVHITGPHKQAVSQEQTKNGLKLTFDLKADGFVEFGVIETRVSRTAWTLVGSSGFQRLVNFFAQSNDASAVKLRQTDSFRKCEEINTTLQGVFQDIAKNEKEVESLEQEQDRLLKLVQAGSASAQIDKWQTNLDTCEDRIQQLQKTIIPGGERLSNELEKQLDAALKALSFSWASGDENESGK